MNTTNRLDNDLAALRDDMSDLKRDFLEIMDQFKKDTARRAHKSAERFEDRAKWMYQDVTAEGVKSAKLIGKQIEAQPVAATLIALSLGGLGYLGYRAFTR